MPNPTSPRRSSSSSSVAAAASGNEQLPPWFLRFLDDRQTRKPSEHTMKAYRQDFVAIAGLITGGRPAALAVVDITRDSMRTAFAAYAKVHEAASIRRCWSTWNVLCTYLYTGEELAANPMPLVGRPKIDKPVPKALPRPAVEALLDTVQADYGSTRATDWPERDLALILTGLLAGLRADELRRVDIGDIRTTAEGAAVIHVHGKGGKERTVPVESTLLRVIEDYLDSRTVRFPDAVRRRGGVGGLARWPASAPLFVGRDGQRITRGTLQSRVKRAFNRAGPDAAPVPGALVHGLRHTYATELAAAEVSVYTLMNLLGHESMATSQRYVSAAGTDTRGAAARNPLYGMVSSRILDED